MMLHIAYFLYVKLRKYSSTHIVSFTTTVHTHHHTVHTQVIAGLGRVVLATLRRNPTCNRTIDYLPASSPLTLWIHVLYRGMASRIYSRSLRFGVLSTTSRSSLVLRSPLFPSLGNPRPLFARLKRFSDGLDLGPGVRKAILW